MSEAKLTEWQRRRRNKKKCSLSFCNIDAQTMGLCKTHYVKSRQGLPLTPSKTYHRRGGNPPIICDEMICNNRSLGTPCHVFRGLKSKHGYGFINCGGRRRWVHRYVWEKEHGPIPDKMMIDHQCRNRACCNLDHLRLVTPKQNSNENIEGAMWQINKAKTHCKNGHVFDLKNTRINPDGKRDCRMCKRLKSRRDRANKLLVRETSPAAHPKTLGD